MDDWSAHPVLSGDHVRLEPLSVDHVEGLCSAGSAPDIWNWLSVRQPRDSAEMRRIVQDSIAQPDRLAFAQIDARTGAVAGTTSYYQIVAQHRILSIGHTWIGAPWQRTALNTEAKFLLLRRAFDELGANRVAWETDIRNERSQRAIARLGANREGVLRAHRIRPDGSLRDTVLFAMTAREWPSARNALRAKLS